ncbi:makorin, ring finger protein, 4 [Gadus chalcogrammus]|uniref:makorin, ring finger protein, 4 n=1 Tax=Gadus chalcogrammus TaxID=1042646 RepID=UPI0024C45151|nr:makorin, ring finger protein, 4 [Gadus chalcogrammus]
MDPRTDQFSSLRAGLVCRHYLNGSCRYGSRCNYQHDWPAVPSAQICRYFQKGGCWYGPRCRYLHIPVTERDASFTSRRSSVPQLYFSSNSLPSPRRGSEPALSHARGLVPRNLRERHNALNPQHIGATQQPLDHLIEYGAHSGLEACQELLQSSEVSQESKSPEGSRDANSSSDSGGGAAAAPEDQEETEAYFESKEVTCGICMDKVYEKMSADERRFGILPSCNHSFCLRCIVTWRKTKDLQEEVIKGCPQCRVKSAFYVPHNYWVEGPAKETLIASFKEKCRKRRCSYFLRHGCCPFKAECIYWHDEVQRRRSAHLLQTDYLEDIDPMHILDFVMSITFLHIDDEDEYDLPFHITHGLSF